eukprot:g2147.t1
MVVSKSGYHRRLEVNNCTICLVAGWFFLRIPFLNFSHDKIQYLPLESPRQLPTPTLFILNDLYEHIRFATTYFYSDDITLLMSLYEMQTHGVETHILAGADDEASKFSSNSPSPSPSPPPDDRNDVRYPLHAPSPTQGRSTKPGHEVVAVHFKHLSASPSVQSATSSTDSPAALPSLPSQAQPDRSSSKRRSFRRVLPLGWSAWAVQQVDQAATGRPSGDFDNRSYWQKWKGLPGQTRPPRPSLAAVGWAHLGATIGIFLPLIISQYLELSERDISLSIGSFGASAVLIYAAPKAPLSQPRNLILGHTTSAVVGVACFRLCGEDLAWLSGTLAVSFAITVMNLTECIHPPGGATAYIAAIPSPIIRSMR